MLHWTGLVSVIYFSDNFKTHLLKGLCHCHGWTNLLAWIYLTWFPAHYGWPVQLKRNVEEKMSPGFFFNCKICPKKFLSYKTLKQHKCGISPKEDVIKQEFVDPLRNKETKLINQFTCDICQNILPTEITFEVHMKIHSLEVKANCQYTNCNKVFNKSSLLWGHMINKHGITKKAWKEVNSSCNHCNKVCRDKSQLKMHLKKHSNKKEFQCTTCPKQFKSPRALNNHEKHHKGMFDHACLSCEKRYVSETLLKKHQGEKHSKIKHVFSCDQCGKVFSSKYNLGLHISIHTVLN